MTTIGWRLSSSSPAITPAASGVPGARRPSSAIGRPATSIGRGRSLARLSFAMLNSLNGNDDSRILLHAGAAGREPPDTPVGRVGLLDQRREVPPDDLDLIRLPGVVDLQHDRDIEREQRPARVRGGVDVAPRLPGPGDNHSAAAVVLDPGRLDDVHHGWEV